MEKELKTTYEDKYETLEAAILDVRTKLGTGIKIRIMNHALGAYALFKGHKYIDVIYVNTPYDEAVLKDSRYREINESRLSNFIRDKKRDGITDEEVGIEAET